MAEAKVLEYKCPCCGGYLKFAQESQKMNCEHCCNEFELETIREYYNGEESSDTFSWDEEGTPEPWDTEDLNGFECPSCGGQILTDHATAATFCPYCANPAVLRVRLSGGLKPDAVIPFKTGKEDAQAAFLALCKGKPLLPKDFTSRQQLQKITGTYVPFWLYHCNGEMEAKYRATRLHHWSDSRYHYTKTDYFLLTRAARADFDGIPMDGSTKMDNTVMESLEPYDYAQLADFDTAYLSGYLADKYDVESKSGEERIRQRVNTTMDEMIAGTCIGYASVIPTAKNLKISHSKAKYVLLPVWLLTTRYKDQLYTFAMNGQTGKMTGTLPICPKRTAAWFAGICAAVTALLTAILQLC